MLRKSIVQLIIDFSLVIIMTMMVVLMAKNISPTRRGFYCSDESIRYPHLGRDTVTTTMLVLFTFVVTLIMIITVETTRFVLSKRSRKHHPDSLPASKAPSNWSCVRSVLKLYAVFWFGLSINGLIMEMVKLSGGRLRPYFIDICRPDFSSINCTSGYIETYICTNNLASDRQLMEARKSFPSGHASLSIYVAVFLAYYLRQRLANNDYSIFLSPFLQVGVIVVALFTGVSRVIDYKHHWTDVVAGFLLGIFIALWTNLSLSRTLGYDDNGTENNLSSRRNNSTSSRPINAAAKRDEEDVEKRTQFTLETN